ncbi:MAG TPA: homocysteine S-methyltransferase family protein, partial [Terricaulis sp.]|nr:homocysteine S-methyltransferase family protein [Terricaulis sp.]
AGLPNAMGGYDETPHSMEAHYSEWARAGLLNITGGCCGTTPDHIAHMRHAVEDVTPRTIPARDKRMKLAGLEPITAAA